MKKRLICILLALVLVLCLCACGGSKAPTYTYTDPGQKLRHAEITIRDYGTIKLELDEGVAPITVENFVELANQGFYNGLTFTSTVYGNVMTVYIKAERGTDDIFSKIVYAPVAAVIG